MSKEISKEVYIRARNGDIDARNEIVEANIKLVYKVAHQYSNYKDRKSLIQEGCIGLIRAAEIFDPERGIKFSTFAHYYIKGNIDKFLRDRREDYPYRIQRSDYELIIKIEKAKDKLIERGEELSIKNIANHLGVSEKRIQEALHPFINRTSLNYRDKEDGEELINKIIDENDITEDIAEKMALRKALEKLNDKQKELLMIRYGQEKTQMETAKLSGISQGQLSRREGKILKILKKEMEKSR